MSNIILDEIKQLEKVNNNNKLEKAKLEEAIKITNEELSSIQEEMKSLSVTEDSLEGEIELEEKSLNEEINKYREILK